MKKFTWKEIIFKNSSKGDFVKDYTSFYKYDSFDFALPQDWINWFCKHTGLKYEIVRFSTIWVYDRGRSFPESFCKEVQRAIDNLK